MSYQLNHHIWTISNQSGHKFLQMTIKRFQKASYLASESKNPPQTVKQWLQPFNRAAVLHGTPCSLGCPNTNLKPLLEHIALPSPFQAPWVPSLVCSSHQRRAHHWIWSNSAGSQLENSVKAHNIKTNRENPNIWQYRTSLGGTTGGSLEDLHKPGTRQLNTTLLRE